MDPGTGPGAEKMSYHEVEGFWGKPTSTLDWCERNYEVSFYIAEFWNTVTNLWMILPPLYGLRTCRKQQFENRFIVSYFALLVVGLGSWMFHMTLKYEMQLLDEIPMVFGSAVFTYCITQTRKPVGHHNWLLAFSLLAYCLFFVLVYTVFNHNPLFHEVIYGILVATMMALDLDLTLKQYHKADMRMLVAGVCMYLLGFALWNVDNHFCLELESIRSSNASSQMMSFLNPLTQLHGWWHFFAGYTTYLQINCVIHQRQMYLGIDSSYTFGPVGITVVKNEKKAKKDTDQSNGIRKKAD